MVKVIKKGPDQSVVKRRVCRNCGATLEYVPKDVKEVNWKDYGGGTNTQKWIDCPECSAEIILESW
jgi:uncharacterized protein with PIN domain